MWLSFDSAARWVALGLVLSAGSARAQQAAAPVLPPPQPTIGFTAEYRFDRNQAGRYEWGRRRIAVAGASMRDELIDGDMDNTVLIADRQSGVLLSFELGDPDRIIHRSRLDQTLPAPTLPAMAQGYGPVAERIGPPRLAGERTIAGQSCLRLIWEVPGERQEWCVTAQGIALFARRTVGRNETRSEAVLLTLQPPDAALFELPPGFTVMGD